MSPLLFFSAPAPILVFDKNRDGKLTAEELRPDFAAFGGQPGAPGGFGGRGGDRGAAGGATSGGRGGDGGPGAGGQGGAGRPGGFGGAPNPTGFIDRMFEFDADKDGKLTREELGKMAEQFGRGFGGRSLPREAASSLPKLATRSQEPFTSGPGVRLGKDGRGRSPQPDPLDSPVIPS